MSQTADCIIINAKVFTSDPDGPWAEAVAVSGNRIIHVGAQAEVDQFRGEKTLVVDALGATVTPGFIDSHFHLLWGSIWLGSAQLQQVATFDDLKTVMLEFASENKTSSWVTGRGIKYSIVSTRQELDAIIPDRPVYIGAYDGTPVGPIPRPSKWPGF